MKSATVFLTAVASTLFLQCSTAPNLPASEISDTTAGYIEIEECFKEFIFKSIEICQNALENAQTVMADALLKATDDEKELLVHAVNWLNEYLAVVLAELPEELIDAMNSGSVADLKQVNTDMFTEIDRTTADLAEFKRILPEGEAKEDFIVAIETITSTATIAGEALDKLLSGYNIVC